MHVPFKLCISAHLQKALGTFAHDRRFPQPRLPHDQQWNILVPSKHIVLNLEKWELVWLLD